MDLPHPVSPVRTRTRERAAAFETSSRACAAGRAARADIIRNASPEPDLCAVVYARNASASFALSDETSAGVNAPESESREGDGREDECREDECREDECLEASRGGGMGVSFAPRRERAPSFPPGRRPDEPSDSFFARADSSFGFLSSSSSPKNPPSSSASISPAASNRVYTHAAPAHSAASFASRAVATRKRSLAAPSA